MISLPKIVQFIEGDLNQLEKGEKHYKAGHLSFFRLHESKFITAKVKASMKDVLYTVKVCFT